MNLDRALVFYLLCEYRSISVTSKAISHSPGAIHYMMAELEEDMGVKLYNFQKQGRSRIFHLTDAGERLLATMHDLFPKLQSWLGVMQFIDLEYDSQGKRKKAA